jgi:hypothetical protein
MGIPDPLPFHRLSVVLYIEFNTPLSIKKALKIGELFEKANRNNSGWTGPSNSYYL